MRLSVWAAPESSWPHPSGTGKVAVGKGMEGTFLNTFHRSLPTHTWSNTAWWGNSYCASYFPKSLYRLVVLKLRWCCYRTKLGSTHSHAVKPNYWHWVVVKESAVFISGHKARSSGQLVLKTPELPDGFHQSIFKGQVREGCSRVCDGEVTGWCHRG